MIYLLSQAVEHLEELMSLEKMKIAYFSAEYPLRVYSGLRFTWTRTGEATIQIVTSDMVKK